MAATCLDKFLKDEKIINFLKPALKGLLETYLKLMSEIESEELVGSLETIVKEFKEDISPYAIELCTQLV